MGLKCSVLGHKYGETTVEREREEQGSEVVITIQERETCERCGKTRIVSENKEVTSIETPSDIAGDLVDEDAPDEPSAAESVATEPDEKPTNEPVGSPDDSVVDDGFEEETGVGEQVANDNDGLDPMEESEPIDPDADDAEIIDDTDESESGDVELDTPTTTVDVPDAESETPVTGDETDPDTDDGLILDESAEEDEHGADDRAPGEWPDEPAESDDDWKPETVPTEDNADTESSVESTGKNAVTVPEGMFRCPECGFTTEVESTSLRAGDFCPECHKGALINQTGE